MNFTSPAWGGENVETMCMTAKLVSATLLAIALTTAASGEALVLRARVTAARIVQPLGFVILDNTAGTFGYPRARLELKLKVTAVVLGDWEPRELTVTVIGGEAPKPPSDLILLLDKPESGPPVAVAWDFAGARQCLPDRSREAFGLPPLPRDYHC